MRLIIIAAMALAVSACSAASNEGVHSAATIAAATADAAGVPVVETTTRTTIDEKALTLASKSVSVLAVMSSALVKGGAVDKGSAVSQTIARGLDDARNWVNAAATARDAGNARTYSEALDKAGEAVTLVCQAISPSDAACAAFGLGA